MSEKKDKSEEQRERVDKELKALQAYAAHKTVVNLLEALSPVDGLDWTKLCKAAHYAGAHDGLRAAQNCNNGNAARLRRE